MTPYQLTSSIRSPGRSTTFMEFSPNGRFLAIGDRDLSSLFVLDNRTGYYPNLSVTTPAEPTALAWDTTETFYVGLSDGHFIHYRINLENNELIKGVVNNFFYGGFPATAIALNKDSHILAISVGPEVFVFQRVRTTTKFCFVANVSSRFSFKRDPGIPSPFPKSICFTADNILVVALCRQHTASIMFESEGESRLSSSLQSADVDYSSAPILRAVTSEDELGDPQLARFWVHGRTPASNDECFPFLFINGGMATLSGSTAGVAIIRDTVTQREIQSLEHTVAGRCVSVLAYHVSNAKYTIATVDCGEDATIKVWSMQRSSSHPRISSCHGFRPRKAWVIGILMIALIAASPRMMESLFDAEEISRYCLRIALTFIKLCIKTAYLVLDAVDATVMNAGDPAGLK